MFKQITSELIISLWFDGQRKKAVEYIDAIGWDHFAIDLKHTDDIEERRKLSILTNLLIVKHSKETA